MVPERWQEISTLLHEAMQLAPEQRSVFLDRLDGDPALRRELESLLEAHDQAGPSFLQNPDVAGGGAEPVAVATVMAGRRFGHYRIIEQLGQGGMGEVYRAERDDDQYHKKVAIKVVREGRDSASVLRRFRNERQILANLDHPNVPRLDVAMNDQTLMRELHRRADLQKQLQPIDRWRVDQRPLRAASTPGDVAPYGTSESLRRS